LWLCDWSIETPYVWHAEELGDLSALADRTCAAQLNEAENEIPRCSPRMTEELEQALGRPIDTVRRQQHQDRSRTRKIVLAHRNAPRAWIRVRYMLIVQLDRTASSRGDPSKISFQAGTA